MDTGQGPSTSSASQSAGFLGTRNTALGMDTSVGAIWFGKWYTPYNSLTNQLNLVSSSLGVGMTYSGIMGNPGFLSGTWYGGNGPFTNTAGNTSSIAGAMSFSRTQSNSVNYATPVWSGLRGKIAYGADEEIPTGPAPVTRPELWAASVQYENGPLYLGAAYEQHNDYLWGTSLNTAGVFGPGSLGSGAGTNSKDKGYKFAASYTFGSTFVDAIWERLKYTQSGVPVSAANLQLTNMQRDAWYLGIKQSLGGPHEVRAQYMKANSWSCSPGCPGATGATFWAVAYLYSLDKYTKLDLAYGRLSNDANASYYSGGTTTSGQTQAGMAGNTQSSWNVGISSSF
jgi:predicted porin